METLAALLRFFLSIDLRGPSSWPWPRYRPSPRRCLGLLPWVTHLRLHATGRTLDDAGASRAPAFVQLAPAAEPAMGVILGVLGSSLLCLKPPVASMACWVPYTVDALTLMGSVQVFACIHFVLATPSPALANPEVEGCSL